MTSPFDVVDGTFSVLVNAKGQHSLWPEVVATPGGWSPVFGPTDRAACLTYVAENWTDQPDRHSSAATDLVPLSYNQEFLLSFDKGADSGAFGDRHTLVNGWRLTGPVDEAALRAALDDVVARHEVLRTTLEHDAGGGHQVVHAAGPVRLTVREQSDVDTVDRDRAAEEFLHEIDGEPIGVRELPHLRADLCRFDETDSVLVLSSHHTATDGWSMGVVLRDLAACYTARLAGRAADLPPAGQYQEFAAWQRSDDAAAEADRSTAYWRDKLDGATTVAIPIDHPAPEDTPDAYGAYRFTIDARTTATMTKFARANRSSPFMVLLAAYHVWLRELTGVTDIVTPTFTVGRYGERFADTVGPFFNMLPLRTDLTGCRHFRDVLERSRATCGESYTRDIPFAAIVAQAPSVTEAFADRGGAVAAFEMLQDPSTSEDIRLGETTCVAIRDRRLFQPASSGIPDGALWALDVLPSGAIAGSLKYNRNTFDDSTIAGIVEGFLRTLDAALASPEQPLAPL